MSKTNDAARWVRPRDVPAILELARTYALLRDALEAFQKAAAAIPAEDRFCGFEARVIASRVDAMKCLFTFTPSIGYGGLFAMLAGDWDALSYFRTKARARRALGLVRREFGAEGVRMVRPLLEHAATIYGGEGQS